MPRKIAPVTSAERKVVALPVRPDAFEYLYGRHVVAVLLHGEGRESLEGEFVSLAGLSESSYGHQNLRKRTSISCTNRLTLSSSSTEAMGLLMTRIGTWIVGCSPVANFETLTCGRAASGVSTDGPCCVILRRYLNALSCVIRLDSGLSLAANGERERFCA